MLSRIRITFRGVLWTGLLLSIVYSIGAYSYGAFLELTNFNHQFGTLINRNLLSDWNPKQEQFNIITDNMCVPGNGENWPKMRDKCLFLFAGFGKCSRFTYGRSCAQISIPKIYFDDPSFRNALRFALTDVCATFKTAGIGGVVNDRPDIYSILKCDGDAKVSLSIYISVTNRKVEPPYWIEQKQSDTVGAAYFSARTGEITITRQ